MKVSKRADVAPFYAMEILKTANEMADGGADIMHMETGEPVSGAPSKAIEAAHAALDHAHLGYTEAQGDPILRARIAQHYAEYYGQQVAPERVAVTIGASGGLLLAFLAAFDVGDRVAMADPSYPAYRNTLAALGLETVGLPASPETRFQPTVKLLRALEKPIQGLIISSPSNPTGTMIPRAEFEAVAKYCDGEGIRIISDEIYHGITYGERAETILAYSDSAIVANGFSKYFAMTGWRLGWMVFPSDLVRPVERLAQNIFISPPALSQHVALAAFDCREELDANVARYAENRKILQLALPQAGFGDLAPSDGAFYVYADVSRLTNDSQQFCQDMLKATGVAVTPGIDFDTARGNRYVRISFASDRETVSRAADALIHWLKSE
jgi:aspartate/methionine/tyrosine aminotransferase